MQGHLVLNKFSDCLNFGVLFFRFPGAVGMQIAFGRVRRKTAPTGPGGSKIGLKTENYSKTYN